MNQGLLDKTAFQPAVEKAWTALNSCVEADGKLTHVQPIGADPKNFAETSTEIYGVGAYLLAGSEMFHMAVLEKPWSVIVKVTNPSTFRRDCETVELNDLITFPFVPVFNRPPNYRLAVMDGHSSRILDSQGYKSEGDTQPGRFKDRLVFQVDLAPGETRQYYIMDAENLPATPQSLIKTFARHVPERYDDFAWESDRIAHRTYGLALIPAEGTISSGPDVWIKRQRNLIIDKMYKSQQYHVDNGDEMDDYRVGNSRGCGGTGIWDGKRLYVSSNYRNWKLITTGPIRSEFELTYDPWVADAAGRKVAMTERISIDANSWFSRMQTTFTSDDPSPLTVAVGLAERPGHEKATYGLKAGWVAYWQPVDAPKGTMGVGLILKPGTISQFTNDNPNLPESAFTPLTAPSVEGAPPIRNLLAVTRAEVGKPLDYYFGACWDRSGDFTNAVGWESYIKYLAACRAQPLVVTVGK